MTSEVSVVGSMHYVRSSNQRMHWTQEAETRRYWRQMAGIMFKRTPSCDKARIVITFRFPDRRRRDIHNYTAFVVKPIIDGMIDAKVLPDDDDTHLVGPDLRRDATPGPFRILVTIDDLSERKPTR